MKKEKLERIVKFTPAFDKRDPDPKKNYGIGAVQCFMVLKGKGGAVHFTFYTGFYLPEVMKEQIAKHGVNAFIYDFNQKPMYPMGADVGYHSYKPLDDYQKDWKRDNCDWLDGEACYGDGSALRAEKFMEILIREGSDKIWELLEEDYYELFGGGK